MSPQAKLVLHTTINVIMGMEELIMRYKQYSARWYQARSQVSLANSLVLPAQPLAEVDWFVRLLTAVVQT